MLFRRKQLASTVERLAYRVQQLERKHARIEASDALNRLTSQITGAAGTAFALGASFECFAAGLRSPLRRGRAGGLRRARQAALLQERWPDGRYMGHADWEEIERGVADAEYMRHAAGGFARAARARRAVDGTFLGS